MFQVMASKTKIYIVLEYVTGGELFDKIVSTLSVSTQPSFVPDRVILWVVYGCQPEGLNYQLLHVFVVVLGSSDATQRG